MQKYARVNMQKYSEIFRNMQAYALTPLVWILRENMQKNALNMQKYALYVQCTHEIYMQNMQALPTLLMSGWHQESRWPLLAE
jgi:hypothetical protein